MDGYIIPTGFIRFDVIFSLAFAIVTALVSAYAYRLYKLTSQKGLALFSGAFLSISVAYIIQTIFNFIIRYRIGELISRLARREAVFPLKILSAYFYTIFFAIGLVLLTYMTLKTNKTRILALLLGVVILPIIITQQALRIFHITALVLLLFISYFYYTNYTKHKNLQSLLILLAFIFLFMSNIQFAISLRQRLFFIAARSLELVAYSCILISLGLINKKK